MLLFRRIAGRPLAFTFTRALNPKPTRYSTRRYAALALSPRSWRECWVSGAPPRIDAVCRTGSRNGPTVWEIRELYVSSRLGDQDPGRLGELASELLEEIAAHAASAGALRMLLRLAEDSPLYEHARHAGYAPLVAEHLYRLRGGTNSNATTPMPDAGELDLRPRAGSDTHALYRLHCGTTPLEVRSRAGMTAAEWADGLEGGARQVTEHVLERDGNLHAWLRVGRANGDRWLSLSARDTVADWVPSLVAWAVRSSRAGGAPLASLVPAYDTVLASSLEEAGFVREGTFEVMARTLAIPVREPGGAVAAA